MKPKYTKPAPVSRIPFRPSYPPSAEQEVIFDAMKNGDEHLHIEASPGSGKSTTLKWAMTLDSRPKAAMLAFSKAIVTEIEPGCAPHVDVKTAHSFGYWALAKKYGRLFLSQGKVQKIFKEEFPTLNPDNLEGKERGAAYGFMFDTLKLVDMMRANLVSPADVDRVIEIINQYAIDVEPEPVLKLLPRLFGKMKESTNVIDFTDMMWLPVELDLDIPKYPMIYVDERQDLNSLMMEYINRMAAGRVMTVGDKNQSIFGFGGADIHSTERLVARFPGKQLGLNVCYRCGTDIVALAATIYPKILPFDKNPTGAVEHREQLDYDMPDGSMILSRRNANLVRPCFEFLKRGRKAIIKGRDIGAGLLKIIRSTKAENIFDLIDKVELHMNERIEKLLKQKNVSQSMIDKITDECMCIKEIALGVDSVAELESRVESLFDEGTTGITLSSIHRSKGLEADQVTIIDYSRIRLNHDKMTDEDHVQEANLHFVAITRAKKVLHLIG